MRIAVIALCLAVTVAGVGLLTRAIMTMVAQFKVGQPEHRTDSPVDRTVTLVREFLGHTRMSRLPVVAIAHWTVMIAFLLLVSTLATAYGQLFDPGFALPLIGHFPPYEWVVEAIAWLGFFGITILVINRQLKAPGRVTGPRIASGDKGSRFFGSAANQAYFVEAIIFCVTVCILSLRGLEHALFSATGKSDLATAIHFPLTSWLGSLFSGMSVGALETAILLVAALKIIVSMVWMMTIGLIPTMGVAWHRFLAFFNIWFKRDAKGGTALGELKPMVVAGKEFDMEAMEDLDEDAAMGVGKVEDFTWKGLLDFSTCTECGRCQSQCPAWNTDKPLSPKLLMLNLRDHAHAKTPWLTASDELRKQGTEGSIPAAAVAEAERPLVGATEGDPWRPTGGAVIDEDVLWSCTTCGACVEQCPVDIEHVDHIVDMRRNRVLVESAFPAELSGLFKNLEKRQNPWGMSQKKRLKWAKDLPFEVKQAGVDIESLTEVDYLFWVGCAGAFEDRAVKTTQAVAELLHIAGVDFAVLGNSEGCTGDSARRAGNEFLYQMLAQPNVEVLNELEATKIVVTCAHCFNTLKNEYPQLGGNYEVVHHTQLLNRLVREGKLKPVAAPEGHVRGLGETGVGESAPSVTYHDPCYLGRHNQVYSPPRDLIDALPGVEYKEMKRNQLTSFCCGAGGARMWMEEKLGSRINQNRVEEAVETGAATIAIGCPFCRVMMSDGLTALQADEKADADMQVLDVAQMLLAAVKRSDADKANDALDSDDADAKESPEGDSK